MLKILPFFFLLLTKVLPAQEILITKVSIISMTKENLVLKDRDVFIVDGIIKNIAPGGTIKKQKHYEVINGRGKFLMPALTDMHVHLERFEHKNDLLLFLMNGVTRVRNMDGRPEILEWKNNILNKNLMGPFIHTAGPILEGKRSFWNDTQKINSEDEAGKAVDEHKMQGYDFIKVYFTLSKENYYAVLKQAKKSGMDVTGHIPNSINIEEAMLSGIKCIEHLDGYEDWIESESSPSHNKWSWLKPYFAMRVDSLKIKTAADLAQKFDTWNCPTLIVKNKISTVDTLEIWHNEARKNFAPGYMLDAWKPSLFSKTVDSISSEEWKSIYRGRKIKGELVKQIYQQNGKILAGTDTPNAFVVPGFSLHEELRNLVDAGLTNYEAILCATKKPAEYFKEESLWGTVEVGKQANLILLSKNPLKNISNTKELTGVFYSGKYFTAEALKQLYFKGK